MSYGIGRASGNMKRRDFAAAAKRIWRMALFWRYWRSVAATARSFYI
jgi:hypothetical protein